MNDAEANSYFTVVNDHSEAELEVFIREDDVLFSIDNPWAGDSISGYGATTRIRLTRDEAMDLARWLLRT